MPTTSWKQLPNTFPYVDIRVEWDSVTRTNNTVKINNVNTAMRMTSSGGYDSLQWTANATGGRDGGSTVTLSSTRQTKASGVSAGYLTEYKSSHTSPSFSVTSSTTSGWVAAAGWSGPDGGSVSAWDFDLPDLGSPSGSYAVSSSTTNSISGRANVTNWGTNATSGAVRSYIANNSGFSGQSYINTSDNALVTHTGLTSNDEYWLRGWAENGGDKTAYFGGDTGITKPLAPVAGTPTIEATTATVPTTINTGGGRYTITKNYRIKLSEDASWGPWTAYTGNNISVTDLQPNAQYDLQTQGSTPAGTTDGSVITFTTMPAGKLVYSNGTVVNAIPRLVNANGTTTMLNVTAIE